MSRWWTAVSATLGIVAVGAALGCRSDIRSYVIHQDVKEWEHYLSPPQYRGSEAKRVSPRAYTVRVGWERTLFVVDDDGVIAFDPVSAEVATRMRAAMQEVAPGLPVKALVYTHYHLDRTSGGAVLQPREVVAHEGCRARWQELGASAAEVLPPTVWLTGDHDLPTKSASVRLLHLPRSHTDTMFAVHLPGERVLFTSDMGWVRALPPLGYADADGAGVEAALDRLTQLDFDVFVPGNFDVGTRRDLVDWSVMFHRGRALARSALSPSKGRLPVEAGALVSAFDTVYEPLKRDYGAWHGFIDMSGYFVVQLLEGAAIGR